MITFLVLIQALSATILGTVSLFPRFQKRTGGGLNLEGWVLLAVGAVAFLIATVSVQLMTENENARAQKRIEQLIERLFSDRANNVMTTPKGPVISPGSPALEFIRIMSPTDDLMVDQRHIVEGKVFDSKRDVWVVVHPMDTSSYWIQPRVSVRSGGRWKVIVYFGRSGDIDHNKRFEVIAIADPREKLNEGDSFSAWPEAKWVSEVVTVKRR